ncbi:OmpH family outer membrane protein [Flavobacterium sp.]|uniref:OmpH family outer membrane protein n=1 Tax=Flavobacterium sp. TaxID=239 RepID=UPI0025CC6AF3|nr:OmpH family outer membrane protein [Flavobacterium sp.]
MKNIVILFALAISIMSCNKPASAKEFKTAYIDTSKLMEESAEAKVIEAKYKDKSKVMGSQLEQEVARFKKEAASFKDNAQKNGQDWAQKKGSELQQTEQRLNYAQQGMLQQLQQESAVEMDSLVKNYRKLIKTYGKEKGYDYIYGSGDASPSILFAKDNYDISKEIIKMINDKYKATGKKETTTREEKK